MWVSGCFCLVFANTVDCTPERWAEINPFSLEFLWSEYIITATRTAINANSEIIQEKGNVHIQKASIQMLTVTSIIIANGVKGTPRWPSTCEWLNKLWYVHDVEYSTRRRNESLTTWINWQRVRLSGKVSRKRLHTTQSHSHSALKATQS